MVFSTKNHGIAIECPEVFFFGEGIAYFTEIGLGIF